MKKSRVRENFNIQDFTDALVSRLIKMARSDKLIIGLDTSWIVYSDEIEHRAMQDMIRSIEALKNTGRIEVVRGEGASLAGKLKKIAENRYSTIIVIGEINSVKKGVFDVLQGVNPFTGKEEKAFVAGVNSEKILPVALNKYVYTRLVEMLTLAIRLSYSRSGITELKEYGIEAKRLDAAAINTPSLLSCLPDAKSRVAICVLSASSARNTVINTVSSILIFIVLSC